MLSSWHLKQHLLLNLLDNPDIHRGSIKTSMYELTTVIVRSRNFEQATDVCKELVQKEGIQSIILCPSFTHEAIANIAKSVGKDVSVNVARGDLPSNMVAKRIKAKEYK